MTLEQLQKGKQLESDIAELIYHKREVLHRVELATSDTPGINRLSFGPTNWGQYFLKDEFLPVDVATFIRLYLAKLDAAIEAKQAELSNL
jgi:hypothetical protein